MAMENGYGFIHSDLEIKILILYILARLPKPVGFNELASLASCDGGVGYFDFADCLADLVRTEHVARAGDTYEITEKGRKNGAVTETDLPYPVRLRASKAASETAKRQSREQLVTAHHDVRPHGGCAVTLSLSDGQEELMELRLHTADEKQAAAIEESVRRGAEKLYAGLMETLTASGKE